MTVSISPVFNGQQFFDNLGNPLSGGKVFQYEAGSTSVEQTTYADDTGTTPNSNPIVLDSSGRMTTDIWLTDGFSYNLVLTAADGTTVLTGVDNVIGVVASSAVVTSTAIWTLDGPATYVSPTSFIVAGNKTFEFAVGNRVQISYAGPTYKYATVTAVSYSAPNTQVTLVNDSTAQNSGMVSAYWSLNTTTGKTVDAGAVTTIAPSTYTTAGTVGYDLLALAAADTATNTRVDSVYKVWTASGTGTYTIAPSPAIASYTVGQIFDIKFTNATTGACTINVNSLGAKNIKQYDYTGAKVDPTISASMVGHLAYDGTDFILTTQLPPSPAAATPFGGQVFTSNGTFTAPSGVTRVKVTCCGGGGGGGSGSFGSGSVAYSGGAGGAGAISYTWVDVTGGSGYAVAVGAAGAASPYAGVLATAGGASSFGVTLATAGGGGAGGNSTFFSNGTAGTPSSSGTGWVNAGAGAVNPWGAAAYGYGGAGGHPNSFSGTGYPGTQGFVMVEW